MRIHAPLPQHATLNGRGGAKGKGHFFEPASIWLPGVVTLFARPKDNVVPALLV